MSPDTVLSGIGQAWNIASGIGGMIQSKRNLKRQLSWQSEENQKARDYNERMVKYQNEENLKQWQRENEYNTLSNQKKRAIAAGMNPDLLYGSGASGGNLAGSSPQLNAPSYGNPMDFSAVGSQRVISDFVNQAANTAQMVANVKKTNADTEKTKEETEGQKETNRILSSDANFRDALNANELTLGNVTITNTKKQGKLTDAQITNMRESTNNLVKQSEKFSQDIAESMARIANLSFEQKIKTIQIRLQEKMNDAEISRIAKQNEMTTVQVQQLKLAFPYVIAQMEAGTDHTIKDSFLKDAQRHTEILRQHGISLTNEGLNLSLEDSRVYNQATNDIGFAGRTIRVFTEFLSRTLGTTVGNLLK